MTCYTPAFPLSPSCPLGVSSLFYSPSIVRCPAPQTRQQPINHGQKPRKLWAQVNHSTFDCLPQALAASWKETDPCHPLLIVHGESAVVAMPQRRAIGAERDACKGDLQGWLLTSPVSGPSWKEKHTNADISIFTPNVTSFSEEQRQKYSQLNKTKQKHSRGWGASSVRKV